MVRASSSPVDGVVPAAIAAFLAAEGDAGVLLPTLCSGFTDSNFLRAAAGTHAYGFSPFRYARQRTTTIMVKAPRRLFEEVVWRQFNTLHADLWTYLEQTTERLIRETIHADAADAETAPEPVALR